MCCKVPEQDPGQRSEITVCQKHLSSQLCNRQITYSAKTAREHATASNDNENVDK